MILIATTASWSVVLNLNPNLNTNPWFQGHSQESQLLIPNDPRRKSRYDVLDIDVIIHRSVLAVRYRNGKNARVTR